MLHLKFDTMPDWTMIISASTAVIILWAIIKSLQAERKILALGGHAPITRRNSAFFGECKTLEMQSLSNLR